MMETRAAITGSVWRVLRPADKYFATVDINAVIGGVSSCRSSPLETEIAETGVLIRSTAKRPVESAILALDWCVVDEGEAFLHEAISSKLPIFGSI
ncbi:hypothetical protein GGD56_000865 [Rhizobium mongolense]|uniref:Uncharacterized protein n=1 Tax=Rhizobium mongolense TaxID=57676 RepID=A0ABR6IH03_9HYPH|nr:hypothetical protein [Rhizobium mongolense]